jgi:hypothetical protein
MADEKIETQGKDRHNNDLGAELDIKCGGEQWNESEQKRAKDGKRQRQSDA